jgi:hypothetical protein
MTTCGLLDAGQISDAEGGQASERAVSKKLGLSSASKGESQPASCRPFLYTRRDASGNPQSNSATSHQQSPQKPPRDHFERGQRLHHLATSSAPDDSVELVPRRANVGAKVKRLPFARSLRRVATSTNAGRLARSPFVLSIARRRPDPDEVRRSRVPHLAWRPTWNSAHFNRPRVDRQVTGLICNSFSVMTVCNPPLWEYSGIIRVPEDIIVLVLGRSTLGYL